MRADEESMRQQLEEQRQEFECIAELLMETPESEREKPFLQARMVIPSISAGRGAYSLIRIPHLIRDGERRVYYRGMRRALARHFGEILEQYYEKERRAT